MASLSLPITLHYGDVVKLKHINTQKYLHSHPTNYPAGSKQQQVTGHGPVTDDSSLWMIKVGHDQPPVAIGSPVPSKAVISLKHVFTNEVGLGEGLLEVPSGARGAHHVEAPLDDHLPDASSRNMPHPV